MRKFIKLDEDGDGVEHLRAIRNELENNNDTIRCPGWQFFVVLQNDKPKQSCIICKELFPKIDVDTTCPWHVYKDKKYLIRRLTEIINYNEEGE